MDGVWLASYPRSGVTFFRHVFERMYGIPTWTLYGSEDKITGLFKSERRWPWQADGSLPLYVVKTHLVDTAATRARAIHIVRDGRDVAVSLAHYARDQLQRTEPWNELLDMVCRGKGTLGHWGIHTLVWAGRAAPTAYVVFDDLIRDPVETVRAAVDTLDLGIAPVGVFDIPKFDDLHKLRPTFFRSGAVGQWKTEMPEALQRTFGEVHGGALDWFEELCDERGKGRTAVGPMCAVA